MTATQELINKLVAGGMEYAAAAGLVARAAVEMTGALTKKSAGAVRQQRYRDRNKASQTVTRIDGENVTKRNEPPLRDADAEPSRTVTNRNESVTSDAASLSISKEEKKDKAKRESRAMALPDGWVPDAKAWEHAVALLGQARAEAELIRFRNHAADKGRTSKNWNAAWRNWVDRAIDYGANNATGGNSRANPAAGRATARETDFLAAVGGGALGHLGKGNAAGPDRQVSGGFDFTDRPNARGEPESHSRGPYRVVG